MGRMSGSEAGGARTDRRGFLGWLLAAGAAGAAWSRRAWAGGEGVLEANTKTSFNQTVELPKVQASDYIHPAAVIIGEVQLGKNVMVAPCAVVRGDEGQPIFIGDDSNVQDGVVLHGLETYHNGKPIPKNIFTVDGKPYSIHIGARVSLAHQSHVHGPAVVGDDTFVGMQALIFRARIGKNCVIEPAAKVIGVEVPDNRFVTAGTVLTKQADADRLGVVDANYSYYGLNKAVIRVNKELAEGYDEEAHPKAAPDAAAPAK